MTDLFPRPLPMVLICCLLVLHSVHVCKMNLQFGLSDAGYVPACTRRGTDDSKTVRPDDHTTRTDEE
ncbi:hypothetical protein M758_UG222900 [Ceratodon purpureus]|nr:hypothetical protein M758_UG222900 [Ceratodon purpureus]